MKARHTVLAGSLLLSACGVPSDPERDPERGPVILSCSGTETAEGADGDHENERQRRAYRIDGTKRTFAQWDDKTQGFGFGSDGLTVSPTEARYSQNMPTIAGIASTRTVTFDRVSGGVVDENLFSNGGSVSFEGTCKR